MPAMSARQEESVSRVKHDPERAKGRHGICKTAAVDQAAAMMHVGRALHRRPVQHKIDRPMRVLGYRTPAEPFADEPPDLQA